MEHLKCNVSPSGTPPPPPSGTLPPPHIAITKILDPPPPPPDIAITKILAPSLDTQIIELEKRGWKAASFIFATEAAERFAFYSIAGNLVSYLSFELHQPLPKAVNLVTNWIGAAYVLGIPGAFLADSYLGRFWTISLHSVCYITGTGLLIVSATARSLKPTQCNINAVTCTPASSSQLRILYTGLYMIAIGTGGIKSSVSPFGADQFDEARDHKQRMKTSFFNWFFFSVNTGAVFAFTVVIYVQDNVGWGVGFALPAAAMVVSLVVLLSGMRRYTYKAPGGSPMIRFAQVFVAAVRNWKLEVPIDEHQLYEYSSDKASRSATAGFGKLQHTQTLSFLDKAAICVNPERDQHNPWRLSSVTQVEEFKLLLRILPIFATTVFLWTGYSQLTTFFVRQGTTLNRKLGPNFQIPPASLPIFSVVNAVFVLPFYDRIIAPAAQKFTSSKRGFTPLQRMGFGLFVAILSMLVAALVERKRLHVVREHRLQDQPGETIPMTIFWLAPQYFLVGLAEIFTYVGQLEFFYDEVSEGMKSLSTSLFISELGIGSWISSLLVTIVQDVTGHRNGWIVDNINGSRIDNFYWLLAVLSGFNFFLFIVTASLHRYNKQNLAEALNII